MTIARHRLFGKLIKSKLMEMSIESLLSMVIFIIIFAIPLSSDIKCREFDEK